MKYFSILFVFSIFFSSCSTSSKFARLPAEAGLENYEFNHFEIDETTGEYKEKKVSITSLEFFNFYNKNFLNFERKDELTVIIRNYPAADADDTNATLEQLALLQEHLQPLVTHPSFGILSDSDHKVFLQFSILKHLNQASRLNLIKECFSIPNKVGQKVNSLYAFNRLCSKITLVENQFLKSTINNIVNFQLKKSVKYNGSTGYHIFKDNKFKIHMEIIAQALISDKNNFMQILNSLDSKVQQAFKSNRYGQDESAKIEIYDILVNMITDHTIRSNYGLNPLNFEAFNKSVVTNLVRKSLFLLFGMTKDDDIYAHNNPHFTISKSKDGNTAGYMCAEGGFTKGSNIPPHKSFQGPLEPTEGDLISSNDDLSMESNDLLSFQEFPNLVELSANMNGTHEVELWCSGYKHTVTVKSIKSDITIHKPLPISYKSQDTINVLMNLALTNEIGKTERELFKRYMTTLVGWKVQSDYESVKVAEEFDKEFVRTDIFIPVSHAMDVNHFNLGTKNGKKIVLSKSVKDKNGDEKQIVLTLMFPDMKDRIANGSLTYYPDQLAELYKKRRTTKNSSLVIMNTSCNSQKTLPSWMLVYRKSLQDKNGNHIESSFSDTPHIIASKRYFSTKGVAAIMSHMKFPLGTIDKLATGSSVPEVIEFLEQSNSSFLKTLSGFFSSEEENQDLDEGNFDPDYNANHPYLFEFGNIQIFENRRGRYLEKEY